MYSSTIVSIRIGRRVIRRAKTWSTSEIVLYTDAPHAFFADYRPSRGKEQAEDGWKKLQGWFTKHGV